MAKWRRYGLIQKSHSLLTFHLHTKRTEKKRDTELLPSSMISYQLVSVVTEHPVSIPSGISSIPPSLSRRPSSGGPGRRGGGGSGGGAPHPTAGPAVPVLGAGKWLLSAPGRPASRREAPGLRIRPRRIPATPVGPAAAGMLAPAPRRRPPLPAPGLRCPPSPRRGALAGPCAPS